MKNCSDRCILEFRLEMMSAVEEIVDQVVHDKLLEDDEDGFIISF